VLTHGCARAWRVRRRQVRDLATALACVWSVHLCPPRLDRLPPHERAAAAAAAAAANKVRAREGCARGRTRTGSGGLGSQDSEDGETRAWEKRPGGAI
jgi:hypothetical protein